MWRTTLFVLFTLFLYSTRTRPADLILDLEVQSNYAFLAMGKTGVTLVDLQDLQNPTEITIYDTYGSAQALELVDDLIYVADGTDGLKILSRENLDSTGELTQIASIPTPDQALDVAVKGKNAFVAARSAGIMVYKTEKNGKKLTELTSYPVDGRVEHILIINQYAYVSNHKNQFFIFNVNNPNNIKGEGAFPIPADVEDYVVDTNAQKVYVATKGKGLLILDISDFQKIHVINKEIEDIKDAYDVSVQDTIAYVASGGKGLYVLDVTNPSLDAEIPILGHDPSLYNANQVEAVNEFIYIADGRDGLRTNLSPLTFEFQEQETITSKGDFQNVSVRGDFAYVAAGEAGIRVIDISDKTAPVSVNFRDTVKDYATALTIHNQSMYVTYRSAGLKEYSLATPAKPNLTGLETAIPGEANDVAVKGQYAYVAAGSAGLQIVDLISSAGKLHLYPVDTPGYANSVFLFEKYAYVADGESGFHVISIQEPTQPEWRQTVNTPGEATAIYVAKQTDSSEVVRTYAFVADGANGLYIVDVTNLDAPVQVATYDTNSFVYDVIVQGKTAFLAERDQGLIVLDISTISDPQLISNQDTPGQAHGLYLGENEIAYVADWDRGLRIIDLQKQAKPQEIGFLDLPKRIDVLVTRNTLGYMVDGDKGMWILNLEDPKAPAQLSFIETPGQAKNLTLDGDRAYIADGTSGLQIVNISDPKKPSIVGAYKDIQNAKSVAVRGGYAYVASGGKKLYILNISNEQDIKEESVFETKGDPLGVGVTDGYIYIVEGDQGMEVVNVEDNTEPIAIYFEEGLPLQDSRAVLVSPNLQHMFVADGQFGFKTFDIRKPQSPQPVYTAPLENGVTSRLTLAGNHIFVVSEQLGVYVFDIFNLNHIFPTGSYQPTDDPTSFSAKSIAVISEWDKENRRYITYLPAGELGLQVLQADGKAQIVPVSLYESPGEATLAQVIRSLPAVMIETMSGHPENVQAKIWLRLKYITFGTLLFFVVSGFWLILLGQFVLPVQSIRDIYKAIGRLRVSLWGRHGPVISVKGGQVIARKGELDRSGPGVARVDLSSAIVFEKRALIQPRYRMLYNRLVKREARKGRRIPRARVQGPGVAFIEPYEGVHGVADLRPQFRLRLNVQAYTRDGIEVKNPVWILFTLGQPPLVLDVAYEGERKPENLRVIQLSEKEIPARAAIKSLDTKNAQRYQHYQLLRQFFQQAIERADKDIVAEAWVPAADGFSFADQYLIQLRKLAKEWAILGAPQVDEFLLQTQKLIVKTDVRDQDEINILIASTKALAGRLLGEAMTNFYDNDFQGKKQRGTVVKSLTDELDPDDKEEIHRYVQRQTLLRYFENIKTMASNINFESQGGDGIHAYLRNILVLAERWGIAAHEEVQQILQSMDALLAEIDASHPMEVRWLAYQISMLADEYSNPLMADYYQYLYQELVKRYRIGLKDLVKTRMLSRFARQSMTDLSNSSAEGDDTRIFALRALELWEQVHPEFEKNLERLRVDQENQVEIDLMQAAYARFERLTESLVRTDYPFPEIYSSIAGWRACIAEMQQISSRINLRNEWKFPDFLKYMQVRSKVRKIVKRTRKIDNLGKPEFKRYADLIALHDYVQYFRQCVNEFRKANQEDQNGRQEIGLCVTNIKQKTQALKQLRNSSFRRPVRQLIRWGEALSDRDPAYIYFYSKQVDGLWKEIKIANQLAYKRYVRIIKRETERIKRDIRACQTQMRMLNGNGEIRGYESQLDEIQQTLQTCPRLKKLPDPNSDSGVPIHVGPFQFLRRRVLAAVYSRALDLDQPEQPDQLKEDYMPWSDLPVHVAAQTFRELVAKEQYDYLYEPKDPQKFNMPKLKGNLARRMRNQGVLSFRFVDQINGDPLKSGSEWLDSELIRYEPRELKGPKVLRARGIKVIAAGFPDLFPVSTKVPEQFLETWRAPWISKALDIRGQHQLQAVRIINQARAQAQRDMAHALARILQSAHSEEALALRVFQALESTAVDADARQFLPRDTMFMLQSFKQWFLPGGDDQQKSIGDMDFNPNQLGSGRGPTFDGGDQSRDLTRGGHFDKEPDDPEQKQDRSGKDHV